LKIAIVGSGFSCASLLWHLALQKKSGNSYYIIDRNDGFGQGLPYTPSHSEFYMNVPSNKLGISPDDTHHFSNWLKKENLSEEFVHRSVFGNYLKDCFEESVKKLKDVTLLQSEVIAIEEEGTEFSVQIAGHEKILVDAVVLATGPVSSPMPVSGRTLKKKNILFEDPWTYVQSKEQFDNILILGTGLTACDIACHALSRSTQKIYMFSRHGLLPQPHNLNSASPLPILPLEELIEKKGMSRKLKLFRDFCSLPGGPWQSHFDQLRPYIPKIWKSLELRDREQFLRHLKTHWNIHRHRLPPPSEKILTKALSEGRIQILKRTLDPLLDVGAVVNTAGISFDPLLQPLLKSLVQAKLIERDPYGLGFRPLHQKLYNLGCSRSGVDWEAMAAKEIAIQAKELAETFQKF
jgi:uncharacterized NAD(P)/FAD-binding protein YdhS